MLFASQIVQTLQVCFLKKFCPISISKCSWLCYQKLEPSECYFAVPVNFQVRSMHRAVECFLVKLVFLFCTASCAEKWWCSNRRNRWQKVRKHPVVSNIPVCCRIKVLHLNLLSLPHTCCGTRTSCICVCKSSWAVWKWSITTWQQLAL